VIRPIRNMRRLLPISLVLAGLLLLVPGAALLIASLYDLTDQDAETALAPLTSIPLDEIGKRLRMVTKLAIPDTAQWKRIRREWGNPDFIIEAVSTQQQIAYCLPNLGMAIDIHEHGNRIPMEASYQPLYPIYGYPPDCERGTIKFRATPGTGIQIDILRPMSQPLPPGELIVVSYWPYMKDNLVGLSLEREARPFLTGATAMGAILIVLGVCLQRRGVLRRVPDA
jgi:hypothetical protein